ncbi:Ribosomal RNA small subunit methyltransferase E [Candidatus Nitrotoga sp. HW29]|uniref:16S rRNA (uracil(1498)-N(3))-methyltransferase n=1 Tax=Candidatus Nitrotoga sp. HW29 TaxID=2886963 RepID=UPI001EF27D5D|nr:16S rRNA (uracil(1498)-N(3))-methyltransferase [Candidatus Nitrotoga sp. HW29]CAH1903872.1 Ribosomal RNA small subunit methyltransferase E [Candidatus Nitrotoga sp. HW29]
MTTPRFYCPPPLHVNTQFELPEAAAHHASRVLRLRINDEVRIFDGIGNELHGRICEIEGKKVALEKLQVCTVNRESPLNIVLVQALSSSEKMDWVIQKATELGATEIQPVQTQRSVVKLTGDRTEKRTQHWHGISIAACEQCGRNILPKVYAPLEFSSWIATICDTSGSKFILLPEAVTTWHEQPKPQGKVTLLIGPEGGFSADEARLARQAGFISIRLGARLLRTETAAVAGIATLQTLWGDFI